MILLRVMGAVRGDPNDAERGQAVVRLFIVCVVAIYIVGATITARIPLTPSAAALLIYMSLATGASLIIYAAVVRSPGVNHVRRGLAMAHDYIGIAFTMAVGGKILLPVYAVLLWVTVGNGLRYGLRYLAAATVLALLSLSAVAYLSPYWRQNPYIVVTLVVTAIIVPAYAYLLLTQTRHARDEATAANRAKSSLLAQASHDLRQPVHAISLFTACLRDSGLGADDRKMLDNIDRSLQSISRLFRSLLDVSALDSGTVIPRMEVVAIGDVLEDVARQNAEAARWAGVTIRVVPTKQLVRVDANLVTTMVQNVVSNALKYASGHPVLIGCRRHGSTLAIEVRDRGKGIPKHHLPRVTEEFYRVREPGTDVEGVGLGLSIVKRLADLMGLDLLISSRSGRGTVVSIGGLPVTAREIGASAPSRPTPIALLDGLRVLLVEDDKDVLLATATLLEKWGCKVRTERAVPAENVGCDLIIADFDLNADVNGSDCIERVRQWNGRKIPAIVMTGHDIGRVRHNLMDADIPILSKPVRPAELRSAVMAQKLSAKMAGP